MKKLITSFLCFLSATVFWTRLCGADSTSVFPPSATAQKQISAVIMHMEPSVYPWGAGAPVHCTDSSKVIQPTFVYGLSNPPPQLSFGAIVVYYCQEDFYPADTNYQTFLSQSWVTASASNPYCSGTNTGLSYAQYEVCSLWNQRPPLVNFSFPFLPAVHSSGASSSEVWPVENQAIRVGLGSPEHQVAINWLVTPMPGYSAPTAAVWLDTQYPPSRTYNFQSSYWDANPSGSAGYNYMTFEVDSWARDENNYRAGLHCVAGFVPRYDVVGKTCTINCNGIASWDTPTQVWTVIGTFTCQ